jgi:hypothetical protein
VLFAVPNAIGGLQGPPVLPVTTSDPMLGTQANLDRINATKAWAITTGDPAQVTAVVDTGVDFDHPDFWATPTGTVTRFATSGSNVVAADCTSGSCAAVSIATSCHATNVCDSSASGGVDTYGHGTMVAGFVGAAVNNSLGIAGVTWQGSILPVRYATTNSSATAANLLAGISYASAQGARIISVSTAMPAAFVGTLVCPTVGSADSAGRLVVAAAGNDGLTSVNYPGACSGAMPVANSEVNGSNQDVIHTGTLPSNYGAWISIAAPGTNVTSTARTAAACPTCDPSYVSATGYATVTGTSFSTPLAAGAAGLVLARSPSTTNAALRSLLASTGVALQAPATYIKRIDLLAAILTFDVAPTAVNLSGTCIPENTDTTAGVSVGTLTSVDADTGLTAHAYTIVGGADAAKFTIGGVNSDQLVLSDGILDYETKPSYAVTVRSTDVDDLFVDQGLVVAVCNINEPPVVSGGPFSLPENSPNGTVVGSIVATDPESGPVSFSITSGNTGGAFTISPTGQITVANSTELDFETIPVFNLVVTVSDGVNNVPFPVTINLIDVPEGGFTIYHDRTAFLTALGVAPAQTQDFEGIAVGTVMNGVAFMPGVSATHNRGLQIFQDIAPPNHVLFWITTGPTATSAYTISITQTYHAFGFDVADFNPATGAGTMQVFFLDGTNTSVPVANTSSSESTPTFFGVISTSPIIQVIWNEPLEVGGASCCEETALDNFVANP